MAQKFRKTHSLEDRRKCSSQLRLRYPDRIPILMERGDRTMPELTKFKFLVPIEATMGRFVYDVRQYSTLKSTQGLFLFVHETILPNGMPMSQIYEKYQDEDGFLYITYSGENTFG